MTEFNPTQLEAWAGLGPWLWSEETICRQIYHFLGPGVLVTTKTDGTPWGDTIDKTNAALIAAAPDLARLVLEKDNEIARLKKAIKHTLRTLYHCVEFTGTSDFDPEIAALEQAMKETSDENRS